MELLEIVRIYSIHVCMYLFRRHDLRARGQFRAISGVDAYV